jgi:prefoldin subunit 4
MDEAGDDVTFGDQEKINEFGRLNNRLMEIRAEVIQTKNDQTKIDDAISDLEDLLDGQAMLLIGEAFVEVSEDEANEYLEEKKAGLATKVEEYNKEEAGILARQDELKTVLKTRFGDSINLES